MDMSPALFYLLVAVALIGAELLIMQFSVFWFMFFGIGALVASLVALVFPEMGWYASTGIFLVGSVGSALLLYPPLKKWQNKPSVIAGHDAIGQRVTVLEAITPASEGKVEWSGADWPARAENSEIELSVGDTAIIKKLEGIRLIVGKLA